MARKVTNEDIIAMNELYAKYGTYAEVARQTGWSASTVRKYISTAPAAKIVIEIVPFDISHIKKFDTSRFDIENWGDLLLHTEEEKREIQELWKELRI